MRTPVGNLLVLTCSRPNRSWLTVAVHGIGDGDIGILTGQHHGGTCLRFHQRDWILKMNCTVHILSSGSVPSMPQR